MGRRQEAKHAVNDEKPKKSKKFLLIFIMLIIIIAIAAIAWYNISLTGTGTSDEKVSFEIPLGSGTDKIASVLKQKDVIKDEFAFKLYVKLNGISNFQAGTYTITKDMSVPEIAKTLQSGVLYKDGYNITFVEGKTFTYVAKTIAENTNNTEQDVYELMKNQEYLDSLISEYWFISDDIKASNVYYPLEGYLFPDTYTFDDKDIDVKDIFKIMLDKMEKVLNKYKTDIQTSGYSAHEILAMASIVENEAVFDKDRKDVASVMYNRLNSKMSLGSDVTTYYAFKIELGSRDLYRNEINTYNAYNTRGPNMEGKLPARTNFYGKPCIN